MSLIEGSIRRPVTVAVVVLLVVLFGIIGMLRVPVQLTPNVDQPVISITSRSMPMPSPPVQGIPHSSART